MAKLKLEWLPGRFAVCRLNPDAPSPALGSKNATGFVSVTRTDREHSIVIDEDAAVKLNAMAVEPGFVALRVQGSLDFALVGILARLTGALADAAIPVFVISTFQTDYLLVKAADADRATTALQSVAEVADRHQH